MHTRPPCTQLLCFKFLANMNSCSRLLYAVTRPSVICLSVCNAFAAYSGGWNFLQYFYGIWYLGYPLTSTKNFMEIVPGEPSVRELNARGVAKAKYSDFGPIEGISLKGCRIGGKLVLITNRKSHMSFWLVSKSVTLNDLERRNGPYFTLFHQIRQLSSRTA